MEKINGMNLNTVNFRVDGNHLFLKEKGKETEKKFRLSSVEAEGGFNFQLVGEVKNFFSKEDDEKFEVYKFQCLSGIGICFKEEDSRFKSAVAIVV